MSKLEKLRALREAQLVEAPKPRWRRPGRPRKPATDPATAAAKQRASRETKKAGVPA